MRAALAFAFALLAACGGTKNPTPSGTPDAQAPAPLPDAGALEAGCAEGGGTCNACAAPETDPYNACSTAVGGCVPFDDTRVPRPGGQLPPVP